MNYFKVSIVGGSNLPHEQIGDKFNELIDLIEKHIEGEISLAFIPTDEYGEVMNPKRIAMPRMYHGTTVM